MHFKRNKRMFFIGLKLWFEDLAKHFSVFFIYLFPRPLRTAPLSKGERLEYEYLAVAEEQSQLAMVGLSAQIETDIFDPLPTYGSYIYDAVEDEIKWRSFSYPKEVPVGATLYNDQCVFLGNVEDFE